METKLLFVKQTFCYVSHHFWIMSFENRGLSYQKTQSNRALGYPNTILESQEEKNSMRKQTQLHP